MGGGRYSRRTAQAGTGSGDLIASNNLSDVANKITAGDNLSVYSADVPSAATVNLSTAIGNAVTISGTSTITKIILASALGACAALPMN